MSIERTYRLTWGCKHGHAHFLVCAKSAVTENLRRLLETQGARAVIVQDEADALEEDADAAEQLVPVVDLKHAAEMDVVTLRKWHNLGMIDDDELDERMSAANEMMRMSDLDRSRSL